MKASWHSKSQGGVLEVARTASANAQGQEEAWCLQRGDTQASKSKTRREQARTSQGEVRKVDGSQIYRTETGELHSTRSGKQFGILFFLVRNDTI